MTPGALLTDFYQLTMLDAYLREDMHAPAVFELFVRRLPPRRNYLVAAGLEQALDYLEQMAFGDAEIEWLERRGGFSRQLLEYLRGWRFEGEVHAMPEGTPFFASEPLLRVTAPLPQAQFVESRLLNIVHFQTLIASKASRIVCAAPGRLLVDFGMRRAHGAKAALFAAHAAYLAGFDGTATALAAKEFDIPVYGTMAHAFVQAHASESAAFEAFARACPDNPVLLVDTYDTEAAVARLPALARRLAADGIRLGGVRLDSGDLAAHAHAVRRLLDEAELQHDTVQLDDEPLLPGTTPLLHPVMRGGRRLAPSPGLDTVRAHQAEQMHTIAQALRDPAPAQQPFEVEISARLQALARQLDAATH